MFLRKRVAAAESNVCNHGYKLDYLGGRIDRLEEAIRALNDRLDTHRVFFDKITDHLGVRLVFTTPGWEIEKSEPLTWDLKLGGKKRGK